MKLSPCLCLPHLQSTVEAVGFHAIWLVTLHTSDIYRKIKTLLKSPENGRWMCLHDCTRMVLRHLYQLTQAHPHHVLHLLVKKLSGHVLDHPINSKHWIFCVGTLMPCPKWKFVFQGKLLVLSSQSQISCSHEVRLYKAGWGLLLKVVLTTFSCRKINWSYNFNHIGHLLYMARYTSWILWRLLVVCQ